MHSLFRFKTVNLPDPFYGGCLFLPYILVVHLVVALCLYKIDFFICGNKKVWMIYRHQSVCPDVINRGETMLCLTDFQESFHFRITVEKFSKSLFQTSSM